MLEHDLKHVGKKGKLTMSEMIKAKVTKAESGWHYRYDIDDMKNVQFEQCTLGKYKGKDFIVIGDGNVREFKLVSHEEGGFTKRVIIPKEIEYSKDTLTYNEVFFSTARKTKFCIDEPSFEGYTFNHYWNGFEIPYFTREVLDEIVKEFELKKVRYVEEKDEFYYWDENAEEEYLLAQGGEYDTEDGKLHLYWVGNGWVWIEDSEVEENE